MCEEIWGNTESQTEDDSASADLFKFSIKQEKNFESTTADSA